jgi:hypothetical protein
MKGVHPLNVECPTCGAPIGAACIVQRGPAGSVDVSFGGRDLPEGNFSLSCGHWRRAWEAWRKAGVFP